MRALREGTSFAPETDEEDEPDEPATIGERLCRESWLTRVDGTS